MKLMTASCVALLAIAPATVGFAQDAPYPDYGAIKKTAGAAAQDAGVATPRPRASSGSTRGQDSGAASTGITTGRSVSAPQKNPPANAFSDLVPAPFSPFAPAWMRNADTGG